MNSRLQLVALAALGLAAFAPTANAQDQTLTVNETITGVSHNYFSLPFGPGGAFVTDSLDTSPASFTADLSQYNNYTFHYTAPAGEKIVISDPGVSYGASFTAEATTVLSTGFGAGGTSTISFDNLQGTPPGGAPFTGYNPSTGIYSQTNTSLTGALSFTGFTLTLSDIPAVPSGALTYYDPSDSNNFHYSPNASTDPGAFVSLQPDTAPATPEPGNLALLAGLSLTSAGLLRRRRAR